MVLGPRAGRRVEVFPGDARRGGKWESFVEAHPGAELVTQPEWDDAEPIAEAVLADPVSSSLLKSDGVRYETPLAWHRNDMKCATSGVDVIGMRDPYSDRGGPYIADLKTTANTEPDRFARHCLTMLYHAQLVWYRDGCRANDLHPESLYIVGVETDRPYAVTVLRLSEMMIELAEKTITLWLERLRVCLDADSWPAYTQSPVQWEPPEFVLNSEAG